jgi:hypothetical protein
MAENPHAFGNADCREAVEEELDDLRHEIEHFQQEKERVREMVGRVGGVPSFNTRLFNTFFAVAIVVCFGISLAIRNEMVRLAMVELAVALVSIKLLILMHAQSKVNHLQLWILSSLEWRLNELMKAVRGQDRKGKGG